MDKPLTTLRSEIENILLRSGYNLASFAKVSGLNRGSLSAILHGSPPKPISLGQLDALTKAFGYPEGWFYPLYTDECFNEEKMSRRRVEPFLIRCAESGRQQCIDELINRIMEYPKPLDVIYSVAEKLFEGGKIQESRPFYRIIVDHEQDSYSERLAISQYRIFKSLESVVDKEEILRAVIRFEPFRGRLPENLQLDGLLKLASVSFTLQRWTDMEKYTDELRALAGGIYREQLRKKAGRRGGELNLLRPLVLYYAHGHLMKATSLTRQGRYDEAKKFTALYADLSWFELLDEEGLRVVEAFRLFAVGNGFTLELLTGNFAALPDYTAFMAEHTNEILPGLVVIMEAANRYKVSVDQVLERFATEMSQFAQRRDSINIDRQYRLDYQLAIYYLDRGRYASGVDYILHSLKIAIQQNGTRDMLDCITLFELSREYAAPSQQQYYRELMKELRGKDSASEEGDSRRSAVLERSF